MHIKIPSDRIGALIGPDGETKNMLEERCGIALDVDSESGSVTVDPQGDALAAMKAMEFVKAVGRGFSPERALPLLEDEMLMLDLLDLSKLVATKNDMARVKGRIIGKDGKTRELMEELSGSRISVYGKTVAIIGQPEQIRVVRAAIEMLLDGAPHGNVYSFLEKKHREMAIAELEGKPDVL
ncbi:MAG: polynucleotide phosphorylase/polyadenylase [Methanosaeta sp. PtaB.Bin039]|nr:MAG: polynucleotide phosphorylase/polyadenylase [Methanosaeta sp. PtaB.Bin039]HQF16925.1 KH domain-containing protein [Methanotrichaceae archaeon]HQI91492.1 KH domain-containing protein [Methanotrichaceae archaeon]HQJ28830.1 KH domain-containing protein [Methanotrichaceae archaeon]